MPLITGESSMKLPLSDALPGENRAITYQAHCKPAFRLQCLEALISYAEEQVWSGKAHDREGVHCAK